MAIVSPSGVNLILLWVPLNVILLNSRDSNTDFGGIAKKVIKDVGTKYPNATIHFASVNLDQSAMQMNGIKKVFYGALSNEKGDLSREDAKKREITNDVIIFPWENLEEQWKEINASQT